MPDQQIKNKKYGRGFWVTLLIIMILIPLTIWLSQYMGSRRYYIASVLVMILSVIPFFAGFESRRPQARELVTLAVMCAIAVAARTIFIWLPHFKPIGGIVMITAMAFGPQAGFMTGSLSLIASDMIFGQGPWTPWQMFSYGLLGFISGFLAQKGILTERKPLRCAIIGFVIMVVVVGLILDTGAIFTMAQTLDAEAALAMYLSGIPVNISQGTAVFLCVLLLSRPMMSKLNRIKVKYGMIEQ